MKIVFKIILICLVVFIGLGSGVILGDELYRNADNLLNGDYHLDDLTLLIPTSLLILSVPSIQFHLKTLKFYQPSRPNENIIIDYDIVENMTAQQEKIKISTYLWICNLVFGLWILVQGLIVLIIIQESFPINEFPNGILRYLVVLGLLMLGSFLIIDEWKMKKLATHNGGLR